MYHNDPYQAPVVELVCSKCNHSVKTQFSHLIPKHGCKQRQIDALALRIDKLENPWRYRVREV